MFMMETLMQVLLKWNDAVAVLEKLQYEVFLAHIFSGDWWNPL